MMIPEMPSGRCLSIRRLPAGQVTNAREAGWEGATVFLEVGEQDRALPADSLVEVEDGAMLYLGQVRGWSESIVRVLVEHSLDRARLAAVHETWE